MCGDSNFRVNVTERGKEELGASRGPCRAFFFPLNDLRSPERRRDNLLPALRAFSIWWIANSGVNFPRMPNLPAGGILRSRYSKGGVQTARQFPFVSVDMSHQTSRLRTSLKLLAVAAGLLLLSLVAMQRLPLFQGTSAETVSAEADTAPADAEALPTDDASLSDQNPFTDYTPALSGSASGQVAPRPVRERSERIASNVNVEFHQERNDPVPLPPENVHDDEMLAGEVRELQSRIEELERQAVEWKRLATAADASETQQELRAMEARFHEQQLELRTVVERLAAADERMRTIQESVKDFASNPGGAQSASATRIAIRTANVNGKPHIVLDARDASLPELLARLGEVSGVNLLVLPEVSGTVSLHLTAAPGEEMLEAVCRAHHCRQTRTGNIVLVSRESAGDPPSVTAAPPTVTKLYHLQHLSGPEMRPYVQALLTPGVGTVNFTMIRERVGRTEYRDPPRAIIVKDKAEVIADVDRLILELDRPPVNGKALRSLNPPRVERTRQSPAPAPPVAKPLPVSQTQAINSLKPAPVPPPPSEAWPSRKAPEESEPLSLPALEVPQGPDLLPTGTDLPGPLLDSEDFEPPIVRDAAE